MKTLRHGPLIVDRPPMPSSFRSVRHQRLAQLLAEYRHIAGLHQADVARQLNRHQPFIANIESGQRRVDVVEFLAIAAVIGFDPHEAIDKILKLRINVVAGRIVAHRKDIEEIIELAPAVLSRRRTVIAMMKRTDDAFKAASWNTYDYSDQSIYRNLDLSDAEWQWKLTRRNEIYRRLWLAD